MSTQSPAFQEVQPSDDTTARHEDHVIADIRELQRTFDDAELHADTDRLNTLLNDVEHIFDAFEALGAVTSVQGVASEIFSMDLDDGTMLPFGTGSPFNAGQAAALRERLAKPARLARP